MWPEEMAQTDKSNKAAKCFVRRPAFLKQQHLLWLDISVQDLRWIYFWFVLIGDATDWKPHLLHVGFRGPQNYWLSIVICEWGLLSHSKSVHHLEVLLCSQLLLEEPMEAMARRAFFTNIHLVCQLCPFLIDTHASYLPTGLLQRVLYELWQHSG